MQIIVAFPKMENAKSIKNILVKHGFHVGAVCITGDQTLQHADILGEGLVVCTARLRDMMWRQLREYLPSTFEMIVLASGDFWEGEEMEQVTRLAMPLKVHELIGMTEMVTASMEKRKRQKKFRRGERSQEEEEVLRSAKQILMKRKSMTEEEAHRYIQKCSMDTGRGLLETARMIQSMIGGGSDDSEHDRGRFR